MDEDTHKRVNQLESDEVINWKEIREIIDIACRQVSPNDREDILAAVDRTVAESDDIVTGEELGLAADGIVVDEETLAFILARIEKDFEEVMNLQAGKIAFRNTYADHLKSLRSALGKEPIDRFDALEIDPLPDTHNAPVRGLEKNE